MRVVLLAAVLGACRPVNEWKTEYTTRQIDVAQWSEGHVVFVGAHPGDEFTGLALLRELQQLHGATCTYVALAVGGPTHGCSGVCEAQDAEYRALGELTDCEVVELGLSHDDAGGFALPGRDDTLERWSRDAGGDVELRERLREHLVDADLIVTLDPRHGRDCNGQHMAAGALGLEVGMETEADVLVDTWYDGSQWISSWTRYDRRRNDWRIMIPADPADENLVYHSMQRPVLENGVRGWWFATTTHERYMALQDRGWHTWGWRGDFRVPLPFLAAQDIPDPTRDMCR